MSILNTTRIAPAISPNLAGTLRTGAFADLPELPTIWIPHSCPVRSQHAPNEHALLPGLASGHEVMTALLRDIANR